ncbi:glycosyltransferase [Algoriphagus sp. A40]|uniref:glycosyltransferase n=1 Tax=Algoriphagus sp. A40 TaxID=1945863 RepID=UPI0009841D9F|nr:glycosyltransferase [Algoriphagus sp. A40]OOG68169.1 hypothetical protein B0E43_22470 [Algoriphagus sp. A40]
MEVKAEVAIILLTYNQEKFLEASVESVLNQKFEHSFKLYIFDDYSSDNSFTIALKFEEKFPEKVVSIRNERNLGLARNFEKAILQTKEKYIAYIEGDDYWTDDFKLQRQFEFLNSNPSFVLAFHDYVTIDKDDKIISDINLYEKSLQRNRSKREMVTGCLIHQNTMMFRNVIRTFPKGFFLAKNHDTFFIAYLSNWGVAGYVNCKPLHYRIHKESLWSSLSGRQKHWNGLITYFMILFYVQPIYYASVMRKIGSKMKSILIT